MRRAGIKGGEESGACKEGNLGRGGEVPEVLGRGTAGKACQGWGRRDSTRWLEAALAWWLFPSLR